MSFHCQGCPPYDWVPVDVSSFNIDGDEQMGTKEKFWLRSQEKDERWLWKQARDKDGFTRGEDWAECLVHVVAQNLGLPSVCTSLALRDNKRGVLIHTFLKNGQELEHGNELLAKAIKGYDSSTEREYKLYTVENIQIALREMTGPPPYTHWTAFDVLASYLMLDALVSGCDRHHTNWGILKSPDHDSSVLTPTFDHGNALGFAEPDNRVQELLEDTEQLKKWLMKGRNKYFAGKPRLIELAIKALRLASQASREYFRCRLLDFCLEDVVEAARAFPAEILSAKRGSLACKIVEMNRRRLLDALSAR